MACAASGEVIFVVSIIGWVESTVSLGPLPEADLQWLERELDTVGPEYQKRRTAAVIGLLVAGNIDPFVRAKRYDGKPLDVEATPDLTRDDLYLRRLLPRWAELAQTLVSEEKVFERFNINPERTLRAMHGVMLAAPLSPLRQILFIVLSPTTRRSILPIRSERNASAALIAAIVSRKVLTFDPNDTIPPSTTAIDPVTTI